MFTISCSKEIGTWTIRLNGVYICEYYRERKARETAMKLAKALTHSKYAVTFT